jgi:hypothetical protein
MTFITIKILRYYFNICYFILVKNVYIVPTGLNVTAKSNATH